jgi:ribosomal protein S27E
MFEPVARWLHRFLSDRFKNAQIETYVPSSMCLSRLIADGSLHKGLSSDWPTWNIRIGVVGFIRFPHTTHLALVDCRNTALTFDHMARAVACARIARPHFAFLIAPQGANRSLSQLLTVYRRLDVLEYFAEQGRLSRALIVARWDTHGGAIALGSVVTTDAQKVELAKFG